MLGFAIKYKGILLDLEDDAHLTVEWYSTLFNEAELFRGSYSYAVGLKLTDKNKAALGLPHLLENRPSRRSVEVSVLLLGHTWKNAMLDFSIKGNSLSGNLLIDNAIVADSLQKLTLPDMFSYYNGTEKTYKGIAIGLTNQAKVNYMNLCATQPPGSYPMAWPIFRNYGWSGAFTPNDGRNLINPYNWEALTYNLYNSVFFHCPMFYFHWLINEICTKLGFKAQGSFMDDQEVKRWVVFNNGYYTGQEIMQLGFEVYPSRHLPNISIGAFFKVLRNDMKLGIYFDSLTKIVTINLPDVILHKSKVIDLGAMVVKDSLKIKNSDIKQFVVKGAVDETDSVSTYFEKITSMSIGSNDKPTPVELSIGAPKMNTPVLYEDGVGSMRCAIVDQLANIYDPEYVEMEAFNEKGVINKNTASFRLLSWRGLQEYSESHSAWKIPYATSDNKNSRGIVDSSYMATEPFNEQGWLRKGCQTFYRMLQTQEEIEYDMYMPIDRFADLHPLAVSRVQGKSGGMISVLFDRITFEPAKRNSLLFARMKGYSMSSAYALMDASSSFEINERTEIPDMIYISATISPTRTEEGQDGTLLYGKAHFEFWEDRYSQKRKNVNNLFISYSIDRFVRDSNGDSPVSWEKTTTTGSNVSAHLAADEFIYFSNKQGVAIFKASVVAVGNDVNKYVPIE